MGKRGTTFLLILTTAGAAAVPAGIAVAKNGADDPAGHVRHGNGADDPAGDDRGGRRKDDRAKAKAKARAKARISGTVGHVATAKVTVSGMLNA